jgi:hypothetical protein
MIVGSGQFKYRVIAEWAKLPDGWSFKEVGGVGIDRHDNVYVFNRGEHPMIIFDREGNFLRSWGEGQYPRAHGVHMAPDDTMFLTDDGAISSARSHWTERSCSSSACPANRRHLGGRALPPLEYRKSRTFFANHIGIAYGLMAEQPEQRAALVAETFRIAQLAQASDAAQAVADHFVV